MAHVRAKYWVKYNGEWHKSGDVFEVAEADKDAMLRGEIVTVIEGHVSDVFPPEVENPDGEKKPAKRGRPKKTTAE